jgi:hypothetical protein
MLRRLALWMQSILLWRMNIGPQAQVKHPAAI